MKKTKNKAILVKILLLDQIKQRMGRVNKPVLVFVLTLFLGIGIAFSLGYLYSLYYDRLFATEGIRDTLTYQGKIVNADGVPPPDGNYNLQFKIFDSQTSGNLLWTEIWDGQAHTGHGTTSQVNVSQGVFTVELNSLCRNWVGDCSSNGGVTFAQDSFYLQVELDYDTNGTFEEVFAPRKRFTATPYSMNADKLDGRESSDFVLKSGATMSGELLTPKITDNSIIAYYQFNGTAKNSSASSGLDGSLQGDANVSSDLLNLDGTGDYVLVNDNNLLSFGTGTLDTPFTFSAWVNMNNIINFPILSKGVYNTNGEYWLGTDIDGKLNIRIYDESVDNCYIGRMYTASTLSTGVWTKVVATYNGNGSSSGLKLYVNGEQVDDADSSAACSYVAMENLASALYLGRYNDNYANGKIDDVKLQNRAFTADEVRLKFNSAKERYLNADKVTTLYLYLNALNENNHQVSNGYLYFDPNFNRIMMSNELYAPNNLAYLANGGNDRDYTHFADDHKILAYDFAANAIGSDTVIDLEGHANGTLNNNAFWTNAGYLGYGAKFDNDGDAITFADPGFSATSGAIEMWASLNNIATSETNYFVNFKDSGGVQIALAKQGTSDLFVQVGDSTLTDTTYNFPDNAWHHLALTWGSNNFGVFVDGVSVYTGTYSTLNTPTTFTLGSDGTANTSLNGSLDSVAIYDDVLTADEIKNHFNSGYNSLYISGTFNSGSIQTSLENLLNSPYSQTYRNTSDPVYFKYTNAKFLSLAFSEGYGNKTYSYEPDTIYADIYGATWVRDGYYGPALSFDGVDDYLEIADNDNLDIGTLDFAIEFWINGSADGNQGKKIISKRDGNTGYEIYYDPSSDSIRFFIGDGVNTVDSAATSYDLSDGKWHHFMVNFDRDGNASVFRDGDYWQSTTTNISAISGSLANSVNLLIAKDSSGNFFNGKLDSLIIYNNDGTTPFNYADALHRVNQGPDIFLVDGKNTAASSTTFASFNQSANGDAGVLAITNAGNTAGYPLSIWTDTSSEVDGNTVYNLIYFGSSFLTGSAAFGNLKWDNTNSRFVFDQGLKVTGDLSANYLSTDNNEFFATDIIRHTITAGEAVSGTFTENWNKATMAKIINLHTISNQATNLRVVTDNWNTGDYGTTYDGTTITVLRFAGPWYENDTAIITIQYEK